MPDKFEVNEAQGEQELARARKLVTETAAIAAEATELQRRLVAWIGMYELAQSEANERASTKKCSLQQRLDSARGEQQQLA